VQVGRLIAPLLVAAASVATVTGCGSTSSHENEARPPQAIVIAAAITSEGVEVSPASIGAGPINVVVTNRSAASQVATIEVNDVASSPARPQTAGLRQSTGPINPQDTAQLNVVVQKDTTYTLKTDDDKIAPGRLNVGAERPSAQNDLPLP
jgi:hypothetical protein